MVMFRFVKGVGKCLIVRVFSNTQQTFIYRGDKSANFFHINLRDPLFENALCSTKCEIPRCLKKGYINRDFFTILN